MVPAPGSNDLAAMLATIDVVRRPGSFTYVSTPSDTPIEHGAAAVIDEGDSVTHIVEILPDRSPVDGFVAAWLTLTVDSSLEAVGLTAAVAGALAAAGIPANMLAGHRHDHVLVPEDRADEATAVIRAIGQTLPPVDPEAGAVELVVPCVDLDATIEHLTQQLGLRLASIIPADDPREAVLVGPLGQLRLRRATVDHPRGAVIAVRPSEPELVVPPVAAHFEVSHLGDGSWNVGRAGMHYRDLLPSRQGGRFIASHIRIPDGGPVPDSVHHHRIRFQLIYCLAGWVRVVYEDQGPSFVLDAGDCVLQPPGIRHRVLESSPGLEVVEIGCPAEHVTSIDHELTLPTARRAPAREFDGQRFVRHVAADAPWRPWRVPGFVARDTGIADATGGLGGVVVARPYPNDGDARRVELAPHDAELVLWFVTSGTMRIEVAGERPVEAERATAAAVPPHAAVVVSDWSDDVELLEVTLPAVEKWGAPVPRDGA